MNRITDKKIKTMALKFLPVKDLSCLIGIFVNINPDKDCENSQIYSHVRNVHLHAH